MRGRTIRLESVKPSRLAHSWAGELDKDPALIEIILGQSRRIVRMDQGRLIVETHHGFVCANAGVDQSNTAAGEVTLLPEDPDASGPPPSELPGEELWDPPGRDRFRHLRPALA